MFIGRCEGETKDGGANDEADSDAGAKINRPFATQFGGNVWLSELVTVAVAKLLPARIQDGTPVACRCDQGCAHESKSADEE